MDDKFFKNELFRKARVNGFVKYMYENNPNLFRNLIIPFIESLDGKSDDDTNALNIVADHLLSLEPFPQIKIEIVERTIERAKTDPQAFIEEEKRVKDASSHLQVQQWWLRTIGHYLCARMEIKNKPELITQTKLVLFQIFSCLRQSL